MNFYSLFLVRFAYALQTHFQRVDTFLFSTSVVDITDLLRTRHLSEALRRLSQRAAGWSGGTKIGESLRQFNQRYGRKLLSRDTVFIMLERRMGYRRARSAGGADASRQTPRAKNPVAESAAGAEGLSAHYARHGCCAPLCGCLCSGA